MLESEFDKFADEYYEQLRQGVAFSGESPEYFSEYKIADVRREYSASSASAPEPLELLDFGAGVGASIPYVNRYFPGSRLTCLDPSRRSLEVAEQRFHAGARYVHFDGRTIPFADETFHIAFAMCVFHHIEADVHVALMTELRRVLRKNGRLFIFEHNPFNPLTMRVVNGCKFDEKAVLIRSSELRRELHAAGFLQTSIRYRLFFPHFLRALRPLERALTRVPLGGQYYSVSAK